MKMEDELLVGRGKEYKVSHKNSETKLEEEQLKSLVLVRVFNSIEQEWNVPRVEKYLLR